MEEPNKIILLRKPKNSDDCPLFRGYPVWKCSIDDCNCILAISQSACEKVISLEEAMMDELIEEQEATNG